MTDDGLVALLLADDVLSGLVGNRVMPLLLDENCPLPAITFQVAGGGSKPTFTGSGAQRLRYQFGCHAKRKSQGDDVRRALRKAIEFYQGTLTDGTRITNCVFIQPIDHYDDGPLNFRCSSEFYFYFNQID
jgi:hypothetical protein